MKSSTQRILNHFPFFLILFFITIQTTAQEYRIPYRKGTLWGYADKLGKVAVEPEYDLVSDDGDHGRWKVLKNDKAGVIDETGKEILPVVYDNIQADYKNAEYHDYFIMQNEKKGYADMNGKILLEPVYDKLILCNYPFSVGYTTYNFLVMQDKTWKLIDTTETVFLQDITAFNILEGANYFIEIDDKWGIYSVMTKHWYFEPVYDTIARMYLSDETKLKAEFEEYMLYAKKGKELFLINGKTGELKALGKQPVESLFEPINFDEMSEADMATITEAGEYFPALKSLQEMGLEENEGVVRVSFKKNYKPGILEIRMNQKKEKIGATVNYKGISIEIPTEYEQIYVFQSDGYILEDYLFVQQKSKWGIYGLAENRLIVPVEIDSVSTNNHSGIFGLWKADRMGIFAVSQSPQEQALYVVPAFDELFDTGFIYSIDRSGETFRIYYFKKAGEIYGIGQNGVHFYAED